MFAAQACKSACKRNSSCSPIIYQWLMPAPWQAAPMAAEVLKDAVEDVEYDATPREAGDKQSRDEAALAREQA